MSNPLPVKDWSRAERPREKLLDSGAAALSAAELLAVILRTGSEGHTVLDQARAVLDAAGKSLRGLARLSLADLCGARGIGPAKAAQVLAVVELAKRFGEEEFAPGVAFTGSRDVYAHFRERLAHERHECFYTVLLDTKHRKIRDVCVSQGSLTASIVHPREVFLPVIRESAAAVIFVHNHPSGDPTPSAEDLDITRRLREVGELVGVRVLDHIVIGRGRYVSFVDDGYW
ncbi:MAG: DNA repair protein RadC [Candidatus Binatia bacterium]